MGTLWTRRGALSGLNRRWGGWCLKRARERVEMREWTLGEMDTVGWLVDGGDSLEMRTAYIARRAWRVHG